VEGHIQNDDPAKPSTWTFAIAPAGSIGVGKWHHLVLRWDGSAVAVFVDGVRKARTAYLPIPGFGLSYGGNSSLTFGQATMWADTAIHEFLGRMDDIRFYDYPRSNTQIYSDWLARAQNLP
jgi:hypothetical protein